jgi:acetyl-CoA acetyltransferase
MGSVWIAGSYQSDFARNFAREGLEISDMVAEAVNGTLTSAGLEPEDVESIHVGNAFGQLFTGQGQLGAMPAPVNPSGGLIGVGHPVGATGVRMLHDAARQVTGQAGDCQVEGARTFATLNIGGSLTTTVSFVVTAEK